MKRSITPTASDPFSHVPTGAHINVHVWTGRRDRPEGQYTRSFDADHHAEAQQYAARMLGADGTSKVQVAASWHESETGAFWDRRIDCRPDGSVATPRNKDLASRAKTFRFPDAAIDGMLDEAA